MPDYIDIVTTFGTVRCPVFARFTCLGERWAITPSTRLHHARDLWLLREGDVVAFGCIHIATGARIPYLYANGETVEGTIRHARRFLRELGKDRLQKALEHGPAQPQEAADAAER